MKSLGRYDSALQMFVEEPREPDLARLTFLRWLVERDASIAGRRRTVRRVRRPRSRADRSADQLRAGLMRWRPGPAPP